MSCGVAVQLLWNWLKYIVKLWDMQTQTLRDGTVSRKMTSYGGLILGTFFLPSWRFLAASLSVPCRFPVPGCWVPLVFQEDLFSQGPVGPAGLQACKPPSLVSIWGTSGAPMGAPSFSKPPSLQADRC